MEFNDKYDIEDLKGFRGDEFVSLYGKVYAWRAFLCVYGDSHLDLRIDGVLTGRLTEPRARLYTPIFLRGVDSVEMTARHTAQSMSGFYKIVDFHGTGTVPNFNCTCGLHGYATLRDLIRQRSIYSPQGHSLISGRRRLSRIGSQGKGTLSLTVALVSVAGHIILHERGLRAQHMKIEQLFSPAPRVVRQSLEEVYGIKVYRYNDINRVHPPSIFAQTNLSSLTIPNSKIPSEEMTSWTGNGI